MAIQLTEKTTTLESGTTMSIAPNGVITVRKSDGRETSFSPADGRKYSLAFNKLTGGLYDDTYDRKYGYIQMPDGSTHFINKGASDLSGAKERTGSIQNIIIRDVFKGNVPEPSEKYHYFGRDGQGNTIKGEYTIDEITEFRRQNPEGSHYVWKEGFGDDWKNAADMPEFGVELPSSAQQLQAEHAAQNEEEPVAASPTPAPSGRVTTEEAENIRSLGRTTRAQAGRVLGAFLTGTPLNQAITGIQPESAADKQYKLQLVRSIQALRESNERLQKASGEARIKAKADHRKAQDALAVQMMQGRSAEATAKINQMGQTMKVLQQEKVNQVSKLDKGKALNDKQKEELSLILSRLSGQHDASTSGLANTRQQAVTFVSGLGASEDTAGVIPQIVGEYRNALNAAGIDYDDYFMKEAMSKSMMEEATERGEAAKKRAELASNYAAQEAEAAEKKMMAIYGGGATWAYKHQDAKEDPASPFSAEVKLLDDPQIEALQKQLEATPTGFRTRAMELQKIAESEGYQNWLAENPELADPESGVTERRKLRKYIRETKKELGPQRRGALKAKPQALSATEGGEDRVAEPPVVGDAGNPKEETPAAGVGPSLAEDEGEEKIAQRNQERKTGLAALGQDAVQNLISLYKGMEKVPGNIAEADIPSKIPKLGM